MYLGLRAETHLPGVTGTKRASSGARRSFLFLSRIERAVKNDRVTELAGTLAQLAVEGEFDDPALFEPQHPDHYARRLLWEDPAGRYIVVAITWGPGQSSPLHDHGRVWGAELVVNGVMREAAFRLHARDSKGRCRFVRSRERLLADGDVGVIVPPLEYHEFGNAGPIAAHSIHVYGGSLASARTYAEEDGGWWSPRSMNLAYDA